MRLRLSFGRSFSPRAEEGIALVMALAVLVFLAAITVTTLTMANSSSSTANLSTAGQSGFELAETGLADALSTLENVPTNDPQNANLLGSAASPIVTTASTGSVSWYGVYNSPTQTWTLYSTSTVPSPVGGRAPVQTTVSRTVSITASLNGDWNRIYQDDGSGCLSVPDGVNIPSNVTSRGGICLNGATITGSGTTVTAGGNVTLTPVTEASTSTAATYPTTYGGGSGWTTPGNISAQDNNWASYAVAGSGNSTNLDASGFGFSIPTGATITGIQATVVHKGSVKNNIVDGTIQLLKAGSPVGNNKASATGWNNASQSANYGANNDLWGTTWTAADLDNASFGLRIIAHDSNAAATTAYIDAVTITVTYTPVDDAYIGTSGTPVQAADIGGTCNYNSLGAHTPCSSADQVWATTVNVGSPAMNKPTADFTDWYNNAAPGPKHGCDVQTGTPPIFDNNTTYDNSVPEQQLAPAGASYTCISKDANGNIIGQLSWNATTQVLTISGVVFIDGPVRFGGGSTGVAKGAAIHYQGRGAIYAPGGSHIDGQVCAGGSGPTGCLGSGMSNWDPSQNLLVMIVGDKEPAGHNDCKIDETVSAFQGVYWSKNTCDIKGAGGSISGPIIATDISIGSGTNFYPWPNLGTVLPGVNAGAAAYTFTLGPQTE